MANVDTIHPSDLSMYPMNNCCNTVSSSGTDDKCGCGNNYYWIPPVPMDYPPPPFPCPPCPPPCPPHHHHHHDCGCNCGEEILVSKKSTEGQICKLSKQAAIVNRMIENLDKKKDAIIKVGDVSYNFGNIDLEVDSWKATSELSGKDGYADTVMEMCKKELALIKEKISELAEQLDKELEQVSYAGLFTTVAKENKQD